MIGTTKVDDEVTEMIKAFPWPWNHGQLASYYAFPCEIINREVGLSKKNSPLKEALVSSLHRSRVGDIRWHPPTNTHWKRLDLRVYGTSWIRVDERG